MKPQIEDRQCDNVSPGQGRLTPQGRVIDEYGGMVGWGTRRFREKLTPIPVLHHMKSPGIELGASQWESNFSGWLYVGIMQSKWTYHKQVRADMSERDMIQTSWAKEEESVGDTELWSLGDEYSRWRQWWSEGRPLATQLSGGTHKSRSKTKRERNYCHWLLQIFPVESHSSISWDHRLTLQYDMGYLQVLGLQDSAQGRIIKCSIFFGFLLLLSTRW